MRSFEIKNMQRDAELMDSTQNITAVDKFFSDIKVTRPNDKPDSGRKEAAVLSAAMGAAARIEVEKVTDPKTKKEKEESILNYSVWLIQVTLESSNEECFPIRMFHS